ncbi:hydrolase [Chloroflexota bacterium]
MSKLYEQAETGCCPRFNPESWDEKEISWQDNLFIKDHVRSFLHIPLGFGKMMIKNMEMIQAANALTPEPLMLSDENSLWGSDVYIAVSKEVPQAEMIKISGTFLTKVFEGTYRNTGKWVKEMKAFVKAKGRNMKKMYFFYTTCPACAKVYGKNYTVILVEV